MNEDAIIGKIAECPRCLERLGEKDIRECIKHLKTCVLSHQIDEKLDSARREYFARLGFPSPYLTPFRKHSIPDVFQELARLEKIAEQSKGVY